MLSTPRLLQFQHHEAKIRRPLLVMQDIFYLTLPSHATSVNQLIKTTGVEGRIIQNGERSELYRFLNMFLFKTAFDIIMSERYWVETFSPTVFQSKTVYDFLMDLQSRFYAAWTPTQEDISQLATSITQGFILPEEQDKKGDIWMLPYETIVRMPSVPIWVERIKNSRFLLAMLVLHMVFPDQKVIEEVA